MKRLLFWSVLALSLAVNAAVAVQLVWARTAPMPLFSALSLSSEQKGRLMQLRHSFLAARAENHTRTSELRVELAKLLETDRPDPIALDAVLARISASQTATQRLVVEHLLAVRDVLTPEQRPRFGALMEKQLRAGVPMQDDCASATAGEARP